MYAIVEVGGQQYRVSKGDEIKVPNLGETTGKRIELKDILLISDDKKVTIGRPLIKQAKVIGEVTGQGKEKKVIAFHSRRRKDSKCKQGHRQSFTRLRIVEINRIKD